MSDRLTAMDVENQEFPSRVRGYARDEVRMYLRSVAEEIQRLNLENADFKAEIGDLRKQVADIRRREETLQATLVSAQTMADDMKERARKEAELVVKEARVKANRQLEQAQDQLSRIEDEIRRTGLERDALESRLRGAAEEHIALIDLRKKGREGADETASPEDAYAPPQRSESANLHILPRKTGSDAG